ncbi:MAG: tRNA threonylcarbamoyladenosine dehydratase [Clostridia bacterium]|nr:tRNA threonylcarbamoyladenosine dehydratase [Clostridia bacterium]
MSERFSRTERMLGSAAMERLKKAKVAVFGVGGVGGYSAEALARAGVGAIDVIDGDTIAESNINRQIYALSSTIGKFKADVAAERIKDINSDCIVNAFRIFYTPENAADFDFKGYDYIVDAVDTVTAKLSIAQNAQNAGVPIISVMGAGNKLDPTAFKVADVSRTSICPLARVMRTECKKRGIKNLKVVYSEETALKPLQPATGFASSERDALRRNVPASNSFVPPVAGFIAAGEVIKDLIKTAGGQK